MRTGVEMKKLDLAGFVKAVWEEWVEDSGCDIDGGTLQDLFEKHGIGEWREAPPDDEEYAGETLLFLTPEASAALKDETP
jgi:hypothetical protein